MFSGLIHGYGWLRARLRVAIVSEAFASDFWKPAIGPLASGSTKSPGW